MQKKTDNAKRQQKKNGRPTIYTEELGDKICSAIENTPRGLRWICANTPEFPIDETIREWLRTNAHPRFSAHYARARQAQADLIADEVVDVAYEAKPDKFGRVEKAKLQTESLKWKAKVTKPKVYGDNIDKYLDAKEDAAITTKESIKDRVGKLAGWIAKKKKIEESGDKE